MVQLGVAFRVGAECCVSDVIDRRMTTAQRQAIDVNTPIQMTWLGYADTTGVPTMDYRLTDALADPLPEAETLNTERLIHLPNGFLSFTPPPDSPEVGPLPGERGTVTFGSFNNFDCCF